MYRDVQYVDQGMVSSSVITAFVVIATVSLAVIITSRDIQFQDVFSSAIILFQLFNSKLFILIACFIAYFFVHDSRFWFQKSLINSFNYISTRLSNFKLLFVLFAFNKEPYFDFLRQVRDKHSKRSNVNYRYLNVAH